MAPARAGWAAARVGLGCPARARPRAETHCGRSTALIASAPALDAGARAGKLMRRSENSSSKARPAPVGQAKDMAAAAAVGADKMEVPARHVDRGRGGRETEADQGTVDVVEGTHDLLLFDHFGQRSIGRLLFGLAAHRDGSKTPVDPRRKDARRAVGQRIERRLQLLEGLS